MTNATRHAARRWLALAVLVLGLGSAAGCGGPAKFAAFDLPPEEATYTLTVDHANTATIWQFTSSRVVEDARPDSHLCPEEMHALWLGEVPPPCRPEPLIFLRYDAGVGIDNAVPADSRGRIVVTAYRQATEAPAIAGLELSISTDDGETWEPVTVHRRGTEGTYAGTVSYPKFADTTGTVSVRTEAWDVDGNRVEQTIDGAWFLRERG